MYKIADFYFDFECRTPYFKKSIEAYYVNEAKLTMTLKNSEDEFEVAKNLNSKLSYTSIEKGIFLKKLAEWLPLHNAFVLHSACFDVDGVGVAFAAHSGTGKTTHMRLWQELLGNKMVVVNGDKPIVRFFDEEPETPYAYGTPWNGKEGLGCNMRTPLKHICFIRRDEKNFVEPMDKNDIVDLILNQVYMPKDPLAMMNTMKLIDRLLGSCNLWVIHCNMEKDAAQVAYKTIIKGES